MQKEYREHPHVLEVKDNVMVKRYGIYARRIETMYNH